MHSCSIGYTQVSCRFIFSGMKESVNRRIPLPGVSPEAAHAFIFILYTGSLPEDAVNQPMNHVGVLAEMMCLSHRLELYGTLSLAVH